MKHKTLLFTLLAAATLTACSTKKNQQPTEPQPAPVEARLMTYNLHNCIGMDNRRDYHRIADAIRQARPDVVALQELDSVTGRNSGIHALDTLRALTGMNGFFAAAIPYDGGSYGIGLLSQEKPLSVRTIPMPGREEARTMIVAEFRDYVFCATHQSLTPEDQEASVPLILQAIDSISKPVFLAGDMNSHPQEKPQQLLRNHFTTLNDTATHTYPADQPHGCIDYIYAFTGNGHSFEVTQDTVIAEPVASDHRPVLVTVKVGRH